MKTKIILLLLASTFALCSFAQVAFTGQKSYGTVYAANLVAMKRTFDGGLILANLTRSGKGIDKSAPNHDTTEETFDYWVIKLDSLGRKMWDKTIGGNEDDVCVAVAATRDHGYIVGGTSQSDISGDKTQDNHDSIYHNPDYWIVKLDSLGNKIWDKTIGGTDFEMFGAIDTTNDGGYILGGVSQSGKSGEKTSNGYGLLDYWIVKIDASGNIQWDKTIGGKGDEANVTDIKQTTDGGYIVGGSSKSQISGDKSEPSRGKIDYWVVKLDRRGNKIWDKTLGGPGDYEQLNQVMQTYEGGYLIGGSSPSPAGGDKTENTIGGIFDYDFWIVKLDKNGKKVWDKVIGGNSTDLFNNMVQTRDSGIIMAGYSTSGISGYKTEPNRSSSTSLQDYWIIKFNKQGVKEWDKTVGGASADNFPFIIEKDKNKYVVAGTSASDISGDRTVPVKGVDDIWLVALEYHAAPLVAVANKGSAKLAPASQQDFVVYPNPAKDLLNVKTSGKASFTLTSSSGRVVLTKAITGIGQINILNLPSGVYYLQNIATGTKRKVLIE